MQPQVRWILFEVLKLSVVAALFLWLGGRVVDTRYEIYANAQRLSQDQRLQEARLRGLEVTGRDSLLELTKFQSRIKRWDQAFDYERRNLSQLIDSKAGELRNLIESGMDRIEGTTFNNAVKMRQRVDVLEESIRRHPGQMKNRMIYPVVQLRGNGTVGSGVVVWSEMDEKAGKAYTYIVTAHHVVVEILGEDPEAREISELRFVDPITDKLMEEPFSATLEAFQEDVDVSLLRVEMDEPWPYVAVFASPQQASRIEVFDRVYAVGCPLGNKPLPTAGEISSKTKSVGDQNFWMLNAPTFFGNSGGGVFLMDSGRLVGISSMIYTYGRRQATVVPHMGLFVPLESVRSWLREEGYEQITEAQQADAGKVKRASSSSAQGGGSL